MGSFSLVTTKGLEGIGVNKLFASDLEFSWNPMNRAFNFPEATHMLDYYLIGAGWDSKVTEHTSHHGGWGSAAVGAAIGGGVGAVVGFHHGRKTETYYQDNLTKIQLSFASLDSIMNGHPTGGTILVWGNNATANSYASMGTSVANVITMHQSQVPTQPQEKKPLAYGQADHSSWGDYSRGPEFSGNRPPMTLAEYDKAIEANQKIEATLPPSKLSGTDDDWEYYIQQRRAEEAATKYRHILDDTSANLGDRMCALQQLFKAGAIGSEKFGELRRAIMGM